MIVSDDAALARLKSPMNLINQLAASQRDGSRKSAMSLFGVNRSTSANSTPLPKEAVPVAVIPSPPQPITSNIISPEALTREEVRKDIENIAVVFNPFARPESPVEQRQDEEQPTIDKLITNSEAQMKLGLAHDSALELLTNSVSMLATKLDDVRADRLPSVIAATSKVVESIRRERIEVAKQGKDKEVHYHFYTPVQKQIADYGEVIEVQ